MKTLLWPIKKCDTRQSYSIPANDALADTVGDGTVTPRDSTP